MHALQLRMCCRKTPWYYGTKEISKVFFDGDVFKFPPKLLRYLPFQCRWFEASIPLPGCHLHVGYTAQLEKAKHNQADRGFIWVLGLLRNLSVSTHPASPRFQQALLNPAGSRPWLSLPFSMAIGTAPLGVNSLSWRPAPSLLFFLWSLFLRRHGRPCPSSWPRWHCGNQPPWLWAPFVQRITTFSWGALLSAHSSAPAEASLAPTSCPSSLIATVPSSPHRQLNSLQPQWSFQNTSLITSHPNPPLETL